jgi:hypothetical protein
MLNVTIVTKVGHYARDCWNPTKRVKENVNLIVEDEKDITLIITSS